MPELRGLAIPNSATATNVLVGLSSKSPRLEYLRSSVMPFMNGLLLEASSFFPFLTKVELIDVSDDTYDPDSTPIVTDHVQRLLQLLTPDPGAHPPRLCPSLTELVLNECRILSEEVLLAFLQQQIDLHTDFRRLQIRFLQMPPMKYDVAQFRMCGLDVSLKVRDFGESALTTSPWMGLPPNGRTEYYSSYWAYVDI
ncbi:hypothetical protein B0H19DRAFT_1247296 [Mycena capillaripes]|nr:hypothetical protein B0H19DRAFT_1247296 [Mycena capillaripes]